MGPFATGTADASASDSELGLHKLAHCHSAAAATLRQLHAGAPSEHAALSPVADPLTLLGAFQFRGKCQPECD